MLQLQRARRKYIYPLRRSLSTLNQPTEAGDTTASKDSSDNTEIFYWHPSYLDWPVLAAFSITFLVLAISCQVLLYYSNRSYGLATSYQGLHYLWTYGPTAILTLIASFWARVEYQTKISAPWCRILKGTATSQQSVLLDYVSQFQPFAIYSAVKNKDYPVAASTLASLLLRLTIVISTSLIVLSPLDIRIEDVEVTLKSQFVDNPSGLSTGSHLAYTSLTALVSKDVPLPEGISAKYAYVQAETSIQNISGLITTVDGFEAGLHCDPATVSLSVDTEQESPERDSRGASLDLKSDSCEVSLDVECPDVSGHNSADNFQEPCNSLALSVERCKGSNNTHEMVIGIAASTFMYTPGSPLNSGSDHNAFHGNITILRANSFICTPFYRINPLQTFRTSAGIQVSPVVNKTFWQLNSVSPSDILGAYFFGLRWVSTYQTSESTASASYTSSHRSHPRSYSSSNSTSSYSSSNSTSSYSSSNSTGSYSSSNSTSSYSSSNSTSSNSSSNSTSSNSSSNSTSSYSSYPNGYSRGNGEIWLSGEKVNMDEHSWLSLELANYTRSEIFPNLSSLFIGDNIVQLISSYYQQYTAILARVSLMKDASTSATGSAIVSEQRLLVQIVSTHIITGLLLLLVTMVLIVWRCQPKLFLPQKPNTIIGNAVLLAHSPLRLTGIGAASASDLKIIMDHWVYRMDKVHTAATSNHQLLLCIDQRRPTYNDTDIREIKTSIYRPFSLSIASRLFAFILIINIIATLEILLRKSERNDGIADIPVERSKYQLWTVFPGLLSALINIYTASVDADTRSQGPLLRLRHGAAFEALCLDLVDRHTSTLVLEEVRSRGFESLASTLAVVVTSLLAIFSASLFFATTMLGETQVQLKPSSLIYYPTNIEDHDSKLDLLSHTVGEMILLENASYPAFTYQDLTFPSLVLMVLRQATSLSRELLYDSSQIDIIRGNSPFTFETFFEAIIHPESGCGTDKFYLPTGIDITTMTRDHVYFGNSSFETTKSCSTHVWIWGSWANVSSDDAKAGFRSIYALGCNDTIQTVETSVEFIAQTMAVNPYNPPMPNYLDAVSLTPTNPSPLFHIYIDLPPIARPESDAGLDSFFTIITSSRYAIPVSYLGDTSKVSAVVESIQFHHRILAVQILDQQWRFQNRNLSDSLNLDIPTVLNATARDPSGRNRVVQDVVATRVLQSLLSATLVCLGVNWFLMRNVDVVPRSPTSIANWMALLADGNLDDFLPRDAGQMPLDKISRWCFGLDAVFYLGFRKSPVSGKDVLGIYVVSRHSTLDEPVESGI